MDLRKCICQFAVKVLLFLMCLQIFSLLGLTQNYKLIPDNFSMNLCRYISCLNPSEVHAEAIDVNNNILQSGGGGYVTVFGPKRYIRTTGKPNVYHDTFSSQSLTAPDGIITVLNGEQDGSHRISSALIYINGEQIFGPSDFNQQVYDLKTAINLADINNLKIELRSKPTGYLTILMEQYVLESPTVTIDANPGLIQHGDSSTLTWSSNNSDFCTIEPAIGTVDTSGSIHVSPVETRSYSITATGSGGSASASVTVSVNHKPIANAGSDQSGHIYEIVQLDGSLSSDPEGDALTYQWTFIQKPDTSNTNLPYYTSVKPTFVPDAHGTYKVQLLVSDGMVSSEPDTVVFTTLNRPPVITSPPVTTGIEDIEYTYNVDASDPDGDALTYSLDTPPSGMTIDSASGVIKWTPTQAQIGFNIVSVRVQDVGGLYDTQAFEISVANVNDAPELDPVSDYTMDEGTTLAVFLMATDRDEDTLALSVTGLLPPFASFTDNGDGTGEVSFVPGFDTAGSYPMRVTASDGSLSDSDDFTLTVNNVNRAPSITSSANTSGSEDTLYQYDVEATDPDKGDVLTYSLDVSPFNMTIDPSTGLIQWIPTQAQAGQHDVTVRVTDTGGLFDIQSFTIFVANVNDPPVITPVDDQVMDEGAVLNISLSAMDIDDDTLSLLVIGLPSFASFTDNGEGTGTIVFTTDFEDAGVYTITVTVSDGNITDSDEFILTVSNINRPPAITSTPIICTVRDELYTYDVDALDLDNDSLAFSLTEFPTGMSIEQTSGIIEWTPDWGQSQGFDINEGLMAYYPFNGNANDESGNGNHGIVINAALTDDRCFNPYSAYDFNGANSSIEITSIDQNLKGLTSLSISAWVNIRNYAHDVYIIQHQYTRGFYLGINENGNLNIGLKTTATPNSGGSWSGTSGGMYSGINEWSHLVLRWNGSMLEGYLNAIPVCSIPVFGIFGTQDLIDVLKFRIGRCYYGDLNHDFYFDGTIDDIRIYNRTLSEEEILYLYGQFSVSVKAEDPHGAYDEQSFAITVTEPENTPPRITSSPITTVLEGEEYTYDVEAIDPDGDILTYRLIQATDGMVIDESTGLITWTPGSGQAGNYQIEVQVDDSKKGTDAQKFLLTVAVNNPPVITSKPQLTNICDPPGDAFLEYQAIPTNHAIDWESFEIGGEMYLAVANIFNGSTHNTDSKIYKWEPVSDSFVEIQAIPTHGAHGWESFNIEDDIFLAVANLSDSDTPIATNRDVESKIYKWNADSSAFVEIQSILTHGAYMWKSFSIEEETYLAIANRYYPTSSIYKWNASTETFDEFQAMSIYGTVSWECFEIEGQVYLASANYHDQASNFNIESKIYKWDSSAGSFIEVQSIPTNGAHDWESFVVDGETYLALANYYDGTIRNIDSKIFRWDTTTSAFVEFQSIPTSGIVEWENFTINGQSYLAAANYYDDSDYNIDSKIYEWDSTVHSFIEFQTIRTNGANDWEHFVINGEHYLVVANANNGTTPNIDSIIYKWNGTCFEAALATEGVQYTYNVEAIDPDDDPLNYTLIEAPPGMVIDETTGEVFWIPGSDQVGTFTVTVEVSDGKGGADSQTFVISVSDQNRPPFITSTPITCNPRDQLYVYDVEATDPDNDPISFFLLDFPTGMTIDQTSGVINWIPESENTAGVNIDDGLIFHFPLDGDVRDRSGNDLHGTMYGNSTFTINRCGYASSSIQFYRTGDYVHIQNSPLLNVGNGDLSYCFWVRHDNLDGNQWYYLQAGENATGIRWVSNDSISGVELFMAFDGPELVPGEGRVYDVALEIDRWYFFTVVARNGNTTQMYIDAVQVEDDWEFQYNMALYLNRNWIGAYPIVEDRESINGSIDDLRFYNRALSIEEIQYLYGTKHISVKAEDTHGAFDIQDFSLHLPESELSIVSAPLTIVHAGNEYTYAVEIDPDYYTSVSYTLLDGPQGMTIDTTSGIISWTPDIAQTGCHNVHVRVNNGFIGSDEQIFSVCVNKPPTITSQPDTTVEEGNAYTYDVEAHDPDNDLLTFSLPVFPDGMTINADSGLIEWPNVPDYCDGNSINYGLVAYYPFNSNANDESGNDIHASVNGATLVAADHFGIENNAYLFDGDDNISINSNSAFGFGTGDFSYSFWFKHTSIDQKQFYLSQPGHNAIGALWTGSGFELNMGPPSTFKFFPANIEANKWYNLTVVASDGNTIHIYLNGSQIGAPWNFNYNIASNSSTIGQHPWGSMQGYLDEFRFYNRKLSHGEIHALARVS